MAVHDVLKLVARHTAGVVYTDSEKAEMLVEPWTEAPKCKFFSLATASAGLPSVSLRHSCDTQVLTSYPLPFRRSRGPLLSLRRDPSVRSGQPSHSPPPHQVSLAPAPYIISLAHSHFHSQNWIPHRFDHSSSPRHRCCALSRLFPTPRSRLHPLSDGRSHPSHHGLLAFHRQ